MKTTIIIFAITIIAFVCLACEEDCGKTTYRKEVGVGYVFMYDTINDISYPVAGAEVTVNSRYMTPGMFGKSWDLATDSYITDADGRYQVRFLEKTCFTKYDGNKETAYCNTYLFSPRLEFGLGVTDAYIDINAQDNILMLDTIKLYK